MVSDLAAAFVEVCYGFARGFVVSYKLRHRGGQGACNTLSAKDGGRSLRKTTPIHRDRCVPGWLALIPKLSAFGR